MTAARAWRAAAFGVLLFCLLLLWLAAITPRAG